MFVYVDGDGVEVAGFLGGHLGVADGDDEVAGLAEAGAGAVEADDSTAAGPFDDVGRESVAVGDVEDVDLLVFAHPGRIH